MSTFALDTSGVVDLPIYEGGRQYTRWSDLTPFAQRYVEAMPWDELNDREFERRCKTIGQGAEDPELGFRHLSPEALALILRDCAAFQPGPTADGAREYGAKFWRARVDGFDGWAVDRADYARRFPPLTVSLGDDGKVRLAVAS